MHATKSWAVLFVIPMLWVVPTFSQEASESKDSLYSMALVAGVEEMQKQWGYIDDGDQGSRIRTDYHHLIVRKNAEITDDLPSQSDEFHFEYLDDAALLARSNKSILLRIGLRAIMGGCGSEFRTGPTSNFVTTASSGRT